MLTGIEISSYGMDIGSGLGELVEQVSAAVPSCRLRLGSLEPSTITPELADRLAALPNLCPHFHLSLQSGSAGVLKRMRRKYTPEEYLGVTELLRQRFDDPAITTDIIMGFPGETEEEVKETLTFVAQAGFAAVHVFPYSVREGTKAAEMPDQIPKAEKERRAHLCARAAAESRAAYLARQIGRETELLCETDTSGHTAEYLELTLESGSAARGSLVRVRVTGVDGDGLKGVLL